MAFFLKDYYEFSFEYEPVTILIVLYSVFIQLNLQNSPVSQARIFPLDDVLRSHGTWVGSHSCTWLPRLMELLSHRAVAAY